jgi:hypothetical protein
MLYYSKCVVISDFVLKKYYTWLKAKNWKLPFHSYSLMVEAGVYIEKLQKSVICSMDEVL